MRVYAFLCVRVFRYTSDENLFVSDFYDYEIKFIFVRFPLIGKSTKVLCN